MILRAIVGLFFIGTGASKLFGMGPVAFAEMLAAVGVPFAALNAWLVCAAEIGCGAALFASAVLAVVRARPFVYAGAAGVLAIDMCVAIATVGIRTQRGDPVIVRGVPTAGEPWRLGLEVVVLLLLVIIALLAVRKRPSDAVAR